MPGGARWASAIVAATIVSACAIGTGTPSVPSPSPRDPGVVVVASFDFVESEILAELYGQALRRYGFRVDVLGGVGPRELVAPALVNGLVDLVPEYLGTAVGFAAASQGSDVVATADVNETYAALVDLVEARGIVAMEPAPAQDRNGFAVTADTAERYDLQTISDLEPVADRLVFGGPPECAERPLCLPGLERVYGLEFRSFRPLDASGPVTVAALEAGDVAVALLFTTSPYLAGSDLILLKDDRDLQPAENVVPLVRAAALRRGGERFAEAIQAVSRRLLTDELIDLNRQVVVAGRAPADVARAWLDAKGITG